MSSRKTPVLALVIPAAVGVAVLLVFALRDRGTASSPPAPSRPPAAAPPEGGAARTPEEKVPAGGVRSRGPVVPNSLGLYERARGRLAGVVAKALEQGGPRAAYLKVLEARRQVPRTLEERVERALACRYLPGLCSRDPSLLPEAKSLLSTWAKDDPDAFGRYTALSTLLGYTTYFNQVGEGGLFETDTSERLPEHPARLDEGAFAASPEEAAATRRLMMEVFGREPEWSNRVLIVRSLRAEPKPEDTPFLKASALSDPNTVVRYWSLATLAQLPPTPETRDVLVRAMDADPNENNRTAALLDLASLGYCDDVVASRLIQLPDKDLAAYEAIGKAYGQSRLPSLGGFVRDRLASRDPRERAGAAAAAQASGDAGFGPALMEATARESDPGVRRALARALEKLVPPRER